MRFTPPDEPVKSYETAFDDDLLGRKKVSKELSKILELIEDPLVVALDGRWGTGKTYFLTRWVGAHEHQIDGKAFTVYFDAFAHDYLSDPLIALVGALSRSIPKTEKPKLDQLKNTALWLVKPAARIGLSAATFGAKEVLDEIGGVIADAAGGEAKKAVDAATAFWEREEGRQAAMKEFRAVIETLTNPAGAEETTPLIIVVDELDRCRPDYALEILEIIKHFFAVPHVHFVLGVNLTALENSVRARYGPDIDATSYLQKFLSFTLSLPNDIGDNNQTPSVVKHASHLGAKMGIPNHLLEEICMQLGALSKSNHISIRDVGKIMSTVALLPDKAQGEPVYAAWRMVTITLIVTRVIRPDLFRKLVDASITSEDLMSYLGATKKYITEKLPDGERNPYYDHTVRIQYDLWMFICADGVLNKKEERPPVISLFGTFGPPGNVKQIPRQIYDDWISVFKPG